ncbi:MAG TPA: hypothetical protein ENI80_07920 [Acidiferrobacteraceae bacterium]|nr:hypothetical protein [Acidiferrobacteraceae bacterium]
MNQTYYDQLDKMEKAGINREYIVGWATGFLRSPKVEEQRMTDAYDAGFNDGMDGKTDSFKNWAS